MAAIRPYRPQDAEAIIEAARVERYQSGEQIIRRGARGDGLEVHRRGDLAGPHGVEHLRGCNLAC